MPIKLTSREYRIIGIVLAVAALSLAISLKYFWRAFPEASIDFKVGRDDSRRLAEQFLAGDGFNPQAYRHASAFDYDETAKLYLERTQQLERMNQLTQPGGPIRLWRWSHRWFRPLEKEELRVEITPAGEVAGYRHELAETAPGARLEPMIARQKAEAFLSGTLGRNLSSLEFLDAAEEKLPQRTDHTFTWKDKTVDLGDGSQRMDVTISGDQVSGYREYIDIPELWQRQYEELRSQNNSAQIVDEVFWIFLSIAMIVVLLRRLRHHDVPVRLSLAFGAVAAILVFLDQLNTFSVAQFGYSTTDTYGAFIAGYLLRSVLAAVGMGIAIFLIVAASEPVYREAFPQLPSIGRTLTWQGLRSRSFLMANVIGIGLTFFFFAYQTVFYLAANRLGAWAPSDVPFSDQLNTTIPWVAVLFGGFAPAVLEEMQFRTFAIPFLYRALRLWPVAIILAAFNWGFLHSAYPNQPFFIRGVEVGLGGIIVGVVMLRFGVIATMIWHYSVDAMYTAFILLRSTNLYLKFSGAMTGGIMLIPLAIALIAYWRTGTFADESSVTNAAEGTRRISEAVSPPEMAAPPIIYSRLSPKALLLGGILAVGLVVVAVLPVHRFGEGVRIGITRERAIAASANFLLQRHINVESYRNVAWLVENVDPLTVKYMFERRSVQDTDHIYRQATRLLLWEVRYFRPLEKEEHWVFLDATTGDVFGYRHLLDENAPGASLTPEQARALAEESLTSHGYMLADFELENSETQKRKARLDYTFIWQAKAGDPRNVGDAKYRIQSDSAGDEVVGFSRQFKIPEDWLRQRAARGIANAVLMGILILLAAIVVGRFLFLFIRAVRGGRIAWVSSGKVAILIGIAALINGVSQIATLDRQYDTSIPLSTFHLSAAIGIFVTPLLTFLMIWLLIGIATSLYPEIWNIFDADVQRRWTRDALVAIVISISAAAAVGRSNDLFTAWFHTAAPADIDLLPNSFDAYLPGLTLFLGGIVFGVGIVTLVAATIYVLQREVNQRGVWFWSGLALFVVALGPANAHSLPEYLVGWLMRFVPLVLAVFIIKVFFRNNILAYLCAALCLAVFNPAVAFFEQSAAVYRWNGLLLVVLISLVLAGLLKSGVSRQLR